MLRLSLVFGLLGLITPAAAQSPAIGPGLATAQSNPIPVVRLLPPLPDLAFLPEMRGAAGVATVVQEVPIAVSSMPASGAEPRLAARRSEHSPKYRTAATEIARIVSADEMAASESAPAVWPAKAKEANPTGVVQTRATGAAQPWKPALRLEEIPRTMDERRQMARAMLADARKQLSAGKLDEAENTVIAARELAVDYGRFEDAPGAVAADIAAARQRAKGHILPEALERF